MWLSRCVAETKFLVMTINLTNRVILEASYQVAARTVNIIYRVFHNNNPFDFLNHIFAKLWIIFIELSSLYVRKCTFLHYEKLVHVH